MGFEGRGARRDCYRSVRGNGRPRKLYLGTGPAAEDYARREADRRQERQAEREALNAEQARIAAADLAFGEARDLAELLVWAILILHGFHCHHRIWRRRNGSTTNERQA